MKTTTRFRLPAILTAAAIAAGTMAAFAQAPAPATQSDQEHGDHHPTTTANPLGSAPSGTMPGGMMGQGGQGAMMNGDGQHMMSNMPGMMNMMGAHGGMMPSNIEDRLASLKTELKITETQAPLWNGFADALRASATTMTQENCPMMQSAGTEALPARLDAQEKMITFHLASLKTLKESLDPLYAAFSDEQKKVADKLMVGPMGMM